MLSARAIATRRWPILNPATQRTSLSTNGTGLSYWAPFGPGRLRPSFQCFANHGDKTGITFRNRLLGQYQSAKPNFVAGEVGQANCLVQLPLAHWQNAMYVSPSSNLRLLC